MSLASEALCAASGIFPTDPLGPAEGREAKALAKTWKAASEAFLDSTKPARFKAPAHVDWAKTWEKLSAGIDAAQIATVTASLVDDELATDYQVTLSNAREYLRTRWPVLQMDALPTPVLLPPGNVERGKAESLLAVLNDPARVLDEMASRALTQDQADGFREVFPALADMLRAMLWEGIQARAASSKAYRVPRALEGVLRKLAGLPPGAPMDRMEQPPANASKPQPVAVQFKSLRSRAQALEARDNESA